MPTTPTAAIALGNEMNPLGSVAFTGSLNTYAYRFIPCDQCGACITGSALRN